MTLVTLQHSPTKRANSGARAKILRTLSIEGMLPAAEIAEHIGLTAKQAIDNVNAAKTEGLVSVHRDDVTGQRAYKITDAGRQWVAERGISLKPPPTAQPPAAPSPTDITLSSQLAAIAGESEGAAIDEPDSTLPHTADEEPEESPAPAEYAGAQEAELTVSEDDPPIDAEPIYAATGNNGYALLSKTRLDDAIALARETTEITGRPAAVYRLVKLGETRITVDFVEVSP